MKYIALTTSATEIGDIERNIQEKMDEIAEKPKGRIINVSMNLTYNSDDNQYVYTAVVAGRYRK